MEPGRWYLFNTAAVSRSAPPSESPQRPPRGTHEPGSHWALVDQLAPTQTSPNHQPPAAVAYKTAPTQPCSPPAPPALALALAVFVLSQTPRLRLHSLPPLSPPLRFHRRLITAACVHLHAPARLRQAFSCNCTVHCLVELAAGSGACVGSVVAVMLLPLLLPLLLPPLLLLLLPAPGRSRSSGREPQSPAWICACCS
jgi:hypothetical protein